MENPWTEDNILLLRDYVAKGLSGNQIAKELSRVTRLYFSRNAVIGKIHRLKLSLIKTTEKYHRKGIPQRRAVRVIDLKPRKLSRRELLAQVAQANEPDRETVSFADLAPHHCRWPHDGDGAFVYCGADRVEPFPYCARHCLRAYQPL